MKYHVLTMTHVFDLGIGRYSILASSDSLLRMWIMEREWNFNLRNISCVPRDEYVLEPHSTKKYPDTYAIVGDGVGHYPDDRPRFACVIHRASQPSYLEGCLAPAFSINPDGSVNNLDADGRSAIVELLAYLDRHTNEDQTVKILMNQ